MSQKIRDSTQFYQKYQIESQIGRGSSGICYKVKKTDNGKYYAMKKISSASLKKNNLKSALHQASLLSSLSHPNIIHYYQSFISSCQLFIIMQLAPTDLHCVLKSRKLTLSYYTQQQINQMIYQLLCGLEYIHQRKIVHRDVKTLNVFVDGVKLYIGDLGVGKIVQNDLGVYSRVGTPLYLAPEIIKYEKYDFKADIWGLGCIAYLIATLNHPFEGKNIITLGQNIVNVQPKPIERYSIKIHQLIFDMLQKDHNKRLSAKALIKKYFTNEPTTLSLKQQKQKRSSIMNESDDLQIVQIHEQTNIQEQKFINMKKQAIYQRHSLTSKKIEKSSMVDTSDQKNKIMYKGSQKVQYDKKLGFLVGNFIKQQSSTKKSIELQNKNLQNTLVLVPKNSQKQQQQVVNQQLTKNQKQIKVPFKKSFQSHNNLNKKQQFIQNQKPLANKQKPIQNQQNPIKNEQNPIQNEQLLKRKPIPNQQLLNFNSVDHLKEKPQRIISSILRKDNQYKSRIKIKKDNQEKSYNHQNFDNDLIRDVDQQDNFNSDLNIVTRNDKLKTDPYYQPVQKTQKTTFMRSYANVSTWDHYNNAVYSDIFKIHTNTSKNTFNQNKVVGCYRQRPKSSIGKKEKYSEAYKPKKKQPLLYSGLAALIQTKILKKPEVILL